MLLHDPLGVQPRNAIRNLSNCALKRHLCLRLTHMGPMWPQSDLTDPFALLDECLGLHIVLNKTRGRRANPAFSKACLSDTCHFCDLCCFRGVWRAKPLFSVGRMQICHFRRFRQNDPFLARDKNIYSWQGIKTQFAKKRGLCHPCSTE